MDTAPSVAAYRFEGFVLDIRRGSLLTAAGEALPLRRQSFELLRLLVENAGRLLQTTFTDSPDGARAMYYVRMQLTDPVRGRDVRGWSSPVWLDIDRP